MRTTNVSNLIRNRVNREIKKAKKTIMLNILLLMLIMQKKLEGIRKIVNFKKMTAKPSQLNVGGNIIDDDKEVASNFNHFFVNVGQNTECNSKSP